MEPFGKRPVTQPSSIRTGWNLQQQRQDRVHTAEELTEVDVLVPGSAQPVGNHRVAEIREIYHAAGVARAIGRAEVIPCPQ